MYWNYLRYLDILDLKHWCFLTEKAREELKAWLELDSLVQVSLIGLFFF